MSVSACIVIGIVLIVAIVIFAWKLIKALACASLRGDLD
jgi:hypothetical protein